MGVHSQDPDGKCMWSAGDKVKIETAIMGQSSSSEEEEDEEEEVTLEIGSIGTVTEISDDGGTFIIDFGGDVGQVRVSKNQLIIQSCATDTPLQTTVRKAGLTRVEVVVIILYTGPAFMVCTFPRFSAALSVSCTLSCICLALCHLFQLKQESETHFCDSCHKFICVHMYQRTHLFIK